MKKLLLIVFFILSCKKPQTALSPPPKKEPVKNHPYVVVVYSFGESGIKHNDMTEEKASIGSVLKSGDVLETGPKTRVDIQLEASIFRLHSNSRLVFKELTNTTDRKITKLELQKGTIFCKIKKENPGDEFTIFSPSLVNQITGTELILSQDEDRVSLKVLEGNVETYPRFRFLKDREPNEFLNSDSEFPISSEVEKKKIKVFEGNELRFLASDPRLNGIFLKEEEIVKYSRWISNIHFKSKKYEPKRMEEEEFKTLIPEDVLLTHEMIAIHEELMSGTIDEIRAEELEARRSSIENQILKKQNREKEKFTKSIVKKPKRFKNHRALHSYYERIEKIKLKNGRTEVGAILSQENGIVIMHTERGIMRIPHDDIVDVVYDYQRFNKIR
ncbi:MAG: FecR domain-containing protein [Leptospiraceae bacterium]|nr:FecR domain-containing protein [Leptospiraceae bacterium]MCP5511273.1 FecR domain-containing protein [Leptospiraceae bacterium]